MNSDILEKLKFAYLEKKYPNSIGYIYALICHFIVVVAGSGIQKVSKNLKIYQILNAIAINLIFFNYANLTIGKIPACSKKPSTNRLLILRGLIGPMGAITTTIGISLLPLSEAIAIQMTSPVITAIFAIFFLNEKFDIMLFLNSIFSFAGVLFIAKPAFLFELDDDDDVYPYRNMGIVITLAGSFVVGIIQILLKKLNPLASPFQVTFHFGIFLAAISGIGQIVQGINEAPTMDVLTLIMIGIMNFISHLLLTKSYAFGDAGKISLMFYSQVLFAYMIEIVFEGNNPDSYSIVGSLCIFSSVFVMLYRLHRQRKMALVK